MNPTNQHPNKPRALKRCIIIRRPVTCIHVVNHKHILHLAPLVNHDINQNKFIEKQHTYLYIYYPPFLNKL